MGLAVARLRDMHEETRSALCPPEFATTDRICQRWNSSVGTGVQSDKWQDGDKTPPPPLDDETAIVVDKIILRLPVKTNRLIRLWYRTNLPDMVIAKELSLTPRTLTAAWYLSLNFLRWRFAESNHKTLLAILRWRE